MDSARSSRGGGGGEGTAPAPAVSRRVRCFAVAVCAVVVVHLVATFLWAAPGQLVGRSDVAATSDVPDSALHRVLEPYVTPVFAQSWSIFAPSPLHVEYSLRVRGVYPDGPGGDLVPGPWIDTTAVEVRALTGHLVPAATERPSRRLASETRAALLALPQDARDVVLRPPEMVGTAASPAAAQDAPWPALRAGLLAADAPPDAVDRYLGQDRALAAYATQVLRATGPAAGLAADPTADPTDRTPVYVQASIVRHGVARYGAAERPAPTTLTLGARPPEIVRGQDDTAFRRAWQSLREELPGVGGGTG